MLVVFSNRVKFLEMKDRPVAIITGGGRGIGAACAHLLSERDYAVVLMSLSDSAPRLAAELGGAGISGSVSNNDDLRALVDLAMAKYGRIDAVISSTGHPTARLRTSCRYKRCSVQLVSTCAAVLPFGVRRKTCASL